MYLVFYTYCCKFLVQICVVLLLGFSVKNIASKVTMQRKNTFISHLHAYWQLKRQSLNGVPLRQATRVSAGQLIRSRVRPRHTVSFI